MPLLGTCAGTRSGRAAASGARGRLRVAFPAPPPLCRYSSSGASRLSLSLRARGCGSLADGGALRPSPVSLSPRAGVRVARSPPLSDPGPTSSSLRSGPPCRVFVGPYPDLLLRPTWRVALLPAAPANPGPLSPCYGVGSNSFMGDDDRELKHEAGSRILQESSLSSTAFLEADFYKPRGCLLLLIRVLVFSAIFDYSRLQKVQVLIPVLFSCIWLIYMCET
uniref:Uncharacterized protein n=1 Tax=Ananas comosus var. bracteatus TaxID=296719 RepID=A0A6V7NRX3_ANACO|nr:unnamed protein product [Ananas comosus var. bracteatus]